MADFNTAFDRTLKNEGGFKLTNIANDRGGMTYAGISRRHHPGWAGWTVIDAGDTPPTQLVRDFYCDQFWIPINGNLITHQDVANNIYDFGVNAGIKVAAKLAQIVAGVSPDGVIGPKSIAAINDLDPVGFKLAYALAKVARYRDIVVKDRTQIKFIIGWLNRVLEQAK